MEPLSADDIRRSFVNSTKGQVKAVTLPQNFAELPWESLDFLGWRDPKAPNRGYLVVRRAAGRSGNTVGTYMCADLACSLYIRGLKELDVPQGETATPEVRAERLTTRLHTFVERVLA